MADIVSIERGSRSNFLTTNIVLDFEEIIYRLRVKHKRSPEDIVSILRILVPICVSTKERIIINDFFIRSMGAGSLLGIRPTYLRVLIDLIQSTIKQQVKSTTFLTFVKVVGTSVLLTYHHELSNERYAIHNK